MHVSFSKKYIISRKTTITRIKPFLRYILSVYSQYIMYINNHKVRQSQRFSPIAFQSRIYCGDIHFWDNNLPTESDTMEKIARNCK